MSNNFDTEMPSWILLIASAKISATVNSFILEIRFSGGNAMVFSTINSLIADFSILSIAGPERTGCVQQA